MIQGKNSSQRTVTQRVTGDAGTGQRSPRRHGVGSGVDGTGQRSPRRHGVGSGDAGTGQRSPRHHGVGSGDAGTGQRTQVRRRHSGSQRRGSSTVTSGSRGTPVNGRRGRPSTDAAGGPQPAPTSLDTSVTQVCLHRQTWSQHPQFKPTSHQASTHPCWCCHFLISKVRDLIVHAVTK